MPDKFYNNPREFRYPKGTISSYTPILTVKEREKRFEELSDAAARLMYSVCQEQKEQSPKGSSGGSNDHLITKQKGGMRDMKTLNLPADSRDVTQDIWDRILKENGPKELELNNCRFYNVVIQNVELQNICFANTRFYQCIFQNSTMKGTGEKSFSFDGALFLNCRIAAVQMQNVRFSSAGISDTDFYKAIFEDCSFDESSMRNVTLEECHFTQNRFSFTELASVTLRNSCIENNQKNLENMYIHLDGGTREESLEYAARMRQAVEHGGSGLYVCAG